MIYPGGIAGTSEYDDVLGEDVEFLDKFPPVDFWPAVKAGAKKTLCVIDDLELKGLGKEDRARLDRLVGHVSTHRHVSVFLLTQDFYNIPPIARRTASLFVLWKPRDMQSMDTVSKRVGQDLKQIFTHIATEEHDSVWIDLTPKTPAPLRLNGYTLIHDSRQTGGGEHEE